MKQNPFQTHKRSLVLTVLITLIAQATNPFCCSSCQVSTYVNNNRIELPIPSASATQFGNPSPSRILVNNLPKCHVIKGLEVTLEEMNYSQANVLTVALLTPCGDCIILLNKVGGDDNTQIGQSGPTATFLFSDCKGAQLDCNITGFIGPNPNETLVIQPTDCSPGNYCFGSQIETTFCTTQLSKTFGKPAFGCWQLFTCVSPTNSGQVDAGIISRWKLRIVHGLRAKDGCFDVFTSTCCGTCN